MKDADASNNLLEPSGLLVGIQTEEVKTKMSLASLLSYLEKGGAAPEARIELFYPFYQHHHTLSVSLLRTLPILAVWFSVQLDLV